MIEKPPLGLMPKDIHDDKCLKDEAIKCNHPEKHIEVDGHTYCLYCEKQLKDE